MKTYSKFLALFLAVIMTVASGTFMVSAAEGVTVTAGGVTLSDAATSTISLDQKSIDVAFTEAVDESSLASNVSVLSNVEMGKALHLKKATADGQYTAGASAVSFSYNFPTALTDGTVTVKFQTKYATGTRGVMVSAMGTDDGEAKSVFHAGTYNQEMAIVDGVTNSSGVSSIKPMSDKWLNMEYVINVSAGQYTMKIEDIALVSDKAYTAADNITGIRFWSCYWVNLPIDLSFRDVVITHQPTSGSATTWTLDLANTAVGDRPSNATFGTGFDANTTCGVEEVIASGTTVTMDRVYNSGTNTYTLTNAGDWDPNKTYSLFVNGTKYDFKARDLSGTVTVTAGDVTLSDVDANEIDLTEKTIDVAFSQAVQESTLAANVNLSSVVTEKTLHLYKSDNIGQYVANYDFRYQFPQEITDGTITVKCATKYSSGTRAPIFTLNGYAAGASAVAELATAGLWDNKAIFLNGTSNSVNTAGNLKDEWVTLQFDYNVAANTFDMTVNDVRVANDAAFKNWNNQSKDADRVTEFRFWNAWSIEAPLDTYYKDIEIIHTPVSGAPTTWTIDINGTNAGSSPAGVTVGAGFTGTATAKVEANVIKTPVAVTRSLSGDGKTYSLTNDLGWNTSKNYLLELGTGILTTPGGLAVLDEAKSYSFVARNLGGVLTLDAITDTNGAALAEGGYLGASSKGINLTFSDAVNTDTLNGITLQKKTTDRVLRTTLDATNGQYVTNWTEYAIPNGQSTGVYTFTTSVFVNDFEEVVTATGNKYTTPHIQWMDANGAVMSFIRPAVDRVEYSYYNDTKVTSDSSTRNKMPEATWVDIEYTLDLTNSKYSVKATDTKTGTTATWNGRDTVYIAAAVGKLRFGIYKHEQGTSGFEALWKNPKLTYTATNGEVTPLFDINTDTATQAELTSTFTNSITSGYTGAWGLVNRENAPETVAWTPAYNPTTKTVAIVPNAAFDYLTNYTLTVPTTVMSADGAALYEGAEINFTAIYADGVYSAASGFKAGASAIQTIASDYTGDIKGWASLTNVSGSAKSAVVIVALYKDGKLVDIDTVPVNNIGAGATIPATEGTVTIDADKAGAGYTAAVYVWDSMDTMLPVSLKTTTK